MTHRSLPVTIIGIDPGYDRVGWCVGAALGSELKLIDVGCIETTKKLALTQRYQEIDQQLQEIVEKYTPTEAALESLFFAKNVTTAMHVSEARGVILSVFFRSQLSCYEYTPLQIKQSVTGYGRADKSAVERMVEMQLGSQLKQLNKPKLLDDALDAMAIVLTHAASRKLQTGI